MASSKRTLFLHGGPGLSAEIERCWYGEALPICWWDQPLVTTDDASPFRSLVNAAHQQLQEMAEAAGGPIEVLAHSFAGQIAHALAHEAPQRVKSLTLLDCPVDPFIPLLRLCRCLLASEPNSPLAVALAKAESHLDAQTFQALTFACAGHPGYPAIYFGRGSAAARERYLALLPQVRFLDVASFLAIMNDLLQAPPLSPLPDYGGPVTLVMGSDDPLLAPELDHVGWQRIFPRLQVREVVSGHFVHLETAPEIWWDRR